MSISLKQITKDNYEIVCELEIPDEQQRHLSENIWSLVESHYHDTYQPRAIYSDGQVVGFVMWVHMSKTKTGIWRFMVAYEHQRKGIGRESLQKAIDEIRVRDGLKEIEICYSPDNLVARNLYLSFGFRETGMDKSETEMYAVIDV